jgi:signal recognition particle receptor subunit beta
MALVRHDSREVQFKIVYCGPPRGGKTTNLQYIHRRLDPGLRGDLVSIATERDRTICFDFLPVHETEIAGYRTRFQLYAVPGQRLLAETRRSVLAGADAVVFVADSSANRLEANLEAWRGCREDLAANRIDPDRIPFAYQYNKRDQADAMRPEVLDEVFGVRVPSFLACAVTGYQVFATLDWVTVGVLKGFHASHAVSKRCKNNADAREPDSAPRTNPREVEVPAI